MQSEVNLGVRTIAGTTNARGLERTGRRESRRYMYLTNAPKNETSPYCGHTFDVTRTPRKSCNSCWDFFFTANAEHTKNIMIAVTGGYWREIKEQFGSEYLKQIERFTKAVEAQIAFEAKMKDMGVDIQPLQLEDAAFDLEEFIDAAFAERAEVAGA